MLKLLLIIALVLGWSCTKKIVQEESKLIELSTNIGEEIKSIDPQAVAGLWDNNVSLNMFVGLIGQSPKENDPINQLAESYTYNPDMSVWTFKLRRDAYWVRNEKDQVVKVRPVTAQDVVYSFQRLLKPEFAAEMAYFGFAIKNGEDFFNKKITDPNLIGVKSLDDYTVQIDLVGPMPYFISYLPQNTFMIVPKEVIEKYGQKWTEAENIWCNGAFILEKWSLKDKITLKKNPYYFNAANVQLDKVHFKFIGDYSPEGVRAIRAGDIDISHTHPPSSELDNLRKDGMLLTGKVLGNYFLKLNINKKPLNDIRVRRALALAIDREALVKHVTKNGEEPLYSYIPTAFTNYHHQTFVDPAIPFEERIKEAKKLLAEAGYPEGKGFPELEFNYNTAETHQKIATVIVKDWKNNLGISIKPANQEWKIYQHKIIDLDYDISRYAWVADFPDPLNFLDLFITKGGTNNTGFANPLYDELLAKSRVTVDPAARLATLERLEGILMKELPIIPIFEHTSQNLALPYVSGFYPAKMQKWPMEFVRIDVEARKKYRESFKK